MSTGFDEASSHPSTCLTPHSEDEGLSDNEENLSTDDPMSARAPTVSRNKSSVQNRGNSPSSPTALKSARELPEFTPKTASNWLF